MTGKETETKMLQITTQMKAEIQEKLNNLNDKQKTTKKAYSIVIGFIGQAEKMISMKFSGEAFDEKYFAVRESRVFHSPGPSYFTDCMEWYSSLSDPDLKEAFLVYAHAVQMTRSAFYDKRLDELQKAKATCNVEKEFECNIIIDTLKKLLDAWESWWKTEMVENN